jgi:hypothetical protein
MPKSRKTEGVYEQQLAAVEDIARVTRGKPASEAQVAALEKKLGLKLPEEYAAFLRAVGAVQLEAEDIPGMYGDLRFLGVAAKNKDLAIEPAIEALATECQRWDKEPVSAAPVLTYGELGSECYVIAKGGLHHFRRGTLEPTRQTFEDLFVTTLSELAQSIADAGEASDVMHDVLGRIRERVPAGMLESHPVAGGRVVIVRPRDAARIEIRLGDGREYRDDLHGLFVYWTEPRTPTLDELNDWNRQALFVRGSLDENQRARFRGRLLADGIDIEQFLAALAHDARLPLGELAPQRASADELQRALDHGRVDGSTVVAQALDVGPRFFSLVNEDDDVELAFSIDPAGLVHMRARGPLALAREDALRVANDLHGNNLGDNNLDLEHFVKATLDADAVEISTTNTFAAIGTRAFESELTDLVRTIAKTRMIAGVDKTQRWLDGIERSLGLTLGPITKRVFAAVHDRVLPDLGIAWGLEKEPAQRSATTLGSVVRWGNTYERAASLADRFVPARSIDLGFAVDGARTTDDCPIIGIDTDGNAVRLARDLKAFLSVAALGTTGFDFDGDNERVWRTFRSILDRDPWVWPDLRDLLRELGIAPATDLAKVRDHG